MQQNRLLFVAIVGLAIIVVAGLFLARLFLVETLELPVGQKTAIRVVVAPSIKPWVDEAARAFNQSNARHQVTIIEADALLPETQFQTDQPTPPAAWLAEASFIVAMGPNSGLLFEDAQSVAGTSLAWGTYNDKLADFNQSYGELTWQTLHTKATNPDEALKIVLASPQNSAEGLAALISATAAHLGKQSLTGSDISAATPWLTELLGDRNAQLPPTPATTFASVQGRTLGEAAILALAAWHNVPALTNSSEFTITPATPNVTLDYPYTVWAGPQATPEAKEAAVAFRDFLLSQEQQNRLAQFSFEPANFAASNSVQADGEAVINLLRWAERELLR